MKKNLILFLMVIMTGCYVNYPTTSFWIVNNGDETVNFKASVIKQSSMGPHKMTLPFTIEAGDSTLFRQTGFKTDGNPTYVFSEINFLKRDKDINNPKDSVNWIKTVDENGKPKYIFYVYTKK